jgi:hypothetical protein
VRRSGELSHVVKGRQDRAQHWTNFMDLDVFKTVLMVVAEGALSLRMIARYNAHDDALPAVCETACGSAAVLWNASLSHDVAVSGREAQACLNNPIVCPRYLALWTQSSARLKGLPSVNAILCSISRALLSGDKISQPAQPRTDERIFQLNTHIYLRPSLRRFSA